MATPMLDKARTEELTTSEVEMALRELAAMNGEGSRVGLELSPNGFPFRARVTWLNYGHGPSRWCPSIEDALVAEHDELKRCMAESAS